MSKNEQIALPYNEAAEKAVLGCLLLENNLIIEALETLTPEYFYNGKNRTIFVNFVNFPNFYYTLTTHLPYIKSVLYRTVLNKTVLLKTVLNNKTKFSFLTIIYRTKFSLRRTYEMEA